MKSFALYVSGFFLFILIISYSACTTDPLFGDGDISNPDNGADGNNNNENGTEDNLCPEGIVSFQNEVLPLLISACAYSGCHDVQSHRDGVILDSYDKARKEVKPGNPNKSELYEVLVDDEDDIMPPPPNNRLNNEQINLIKKWIEQGAENTDCGVACDPANSFFAADIFPIIESSCLGCHSDQQSFGNVNLKDYAHIKPYAENGQLLGTLRHDPGYSAMPPSGNQLSDCRIAQIQNWIDEGIQDN